MKFRRLGWVCLSLLAAAGCLTRPLANGEPTTKESFSATVRQQAIDKVDILFMIDGSASMGDKQALLAKAVPDLVNQLLVPANGDFAPVHDMHIGVISSSLGGSDACVQKYADDHGHLLDRTIAGGTVASAKLGFLSYLPDTVENFGKARPSGVITDPQQLQKDFADLVVGVQETGCGLEAQLESWYRFLVQPDPWTTIGKDASGVATLQGIDDQLLAQRKAFLRPDSLLAVIVVTDEEDSWSDPMWSNGRGWKTRYAKNGFNDQGVLPRGTTACDKTPLSPACLQCGTDPMSASDPNCALPPFDSQNEDNLNVRYTDDMQRRYGIAPQFPVQRYIDGLKNTLVPNRASEHGTDGKYLGRATCTNPIFAAQLPADGKGELCNLPRGSRGADNVFFAVIGGVPNDLVGPTIDWTKILGRDPEHFDQNGIDTRMVESITSRGIPGDWDTKTVKLDLQYACTFALEQPKDCSQNQTSCDCKGGTSASPVCSGTIQTRAKAYPTIRELRVAKEMKENGVVASICPKSLDPKSADYGYRPAVASIIEKLKSKLGAQCLPQALERNDQGKVACSVLTVMPGSDQASACPARGTPDARGLQQPDPDVLAAFNKDKLPEDVHPICELTQQLGTPSCEKNGIAGWCYVDGLSSNECVGGSAQAIKFGMRPVGPTVIQCIQQK